MKLPRFFWQSATAILMVISLMLGVALVKRDVAPRQTHTDFEHLDSSIIALRSKQILRDTEAKVLVLWVADISLNARTVVYMEDIRGPVNHLIGYTDQIYGSNIAVNTFMTQLMTGRFSCGQINTSSRVGQYVASVGAPSICRRGLVKDGVLVGYISLSYPSPPSEAETAALDAYLEPITVELMKKGTAK